MPVVKLRSANDIICKITVRIPYQIYFLVENLMRRLIGSEVTGTLDQMIARIIF
jgi:hypothetical protein